MQTEVAAFVFGKRSLLFNIMAKLVLKHQRSPWRQGECSLGRQPVALSLSPSPMVLSLAPLQLRIATDRRAVCGWRMGGKGLRTESVGQFGEGESALACLRDMNDRMIRATGGGRGQINNFVVAFGR